MVDGSGALTPQPWRRRRIAKDLGVSLERSEALLTATATVDIPNVEG
jgi:hypothetical protein